MKTFILVPAYNEEKAIGEVLTALMPLGHTVVVIDDGSTDNTANIARQHGAILLSHLIQLGQGAALQTGIDYARKQNADVAITFDADGQHSPADIARLLATLEQTGADVVLGSRFLGQAEGLRFGRKLMLKLMLYYTNLTQGLRLTDVHNGLRALRISSTHNIQLRQNRMAHASEFIEQIARHKLRYTEVPCTIRYTDYSRAKGQKLFDAVHIMTDLLLRRLYK